MAPNETGVVDRRVRVLRFDIGDARPRRALPRGVPCQRSAQREPGHQRRFPGYAQDLVSWVSASSARPCSCRGARAHPGQPGRATASTAVMRDLRWCGFPGRRCVAGGLACRNPGGSGEEPWYGTGRRREGAGPDDHEGNPLPYPIQGSEDRRHLIVALPAEPVVEYALWLEERLEAGSGAGRRLFQQRSEPAIWPPRPTMLRADTRPPAGVQADGRGRAHRLETAQQVVAQLRQA